MVMIACGKHLRSIEGRGTCACLGLDRRGRMRICDLHTGRASKRKAWTMNRQSVQAWLDNYVEAWRTYDASQIGDLFSEDALYFYSPFDEHDPVRGRAAIVANWLEAPDASDSWKARYVPVAVEGTVAVAQGRTRYI